MWLKILWVALLASVSLSFSWESESQKENERHNILLLITDDQDVTLGSFDHMPHVQALLQEQGVTFVNGFVHTPICCPSRSSILSGRYLHNCGVINNSLTGNCYGTEWIQSIEPHHTFAVHAQKAGYTTAYTGKYLNQYGYYKPEGNRDSDSDSDSANGDDGEPMVPPGWSHWLGLTGNSQYYNYTLVQGGSSSNQTAKRIRHGDKYPQDYLPSVMNQQVLDWIEQLPEPWLIVAAWPTPHGPFTPAPWAVGTMSDVYPPKAENYNASAEYMQQKHWYMRQLHPISQDTASQVDLYYQMRLEALKSIDRHIAAMIEKLELGGPVDQIESLLDRTVVLYTSDNGFQFGQHRLAIDKRHLYENDIRVPFCMRGPGIRANTTSHRIVANIDIAPTILDIAGVSRSEREAMDGVSFWESSTDGNTPVETTAATAGCGHRKDLLISYHGEGSKPCGLSECPTHWDEVIWMPDSTNNTYHCVRTIITPDVEDSMYCRFIDDESFVEYYDLLQNPNQLRNEYDELDAVARQRYEFRLMELLNCQGTSCRAC